MSDFIRRVATTRVRAGDLVVFNDDGTVRKYDEERFEMTTHNDKHETLDHTTFMQVLFNGSFTIHVCVPRTATAYLIETVANNDHPVGVDSDGKQIKSAWRVHEDRTECERDPERVHVVLVW